VNKPLDLALNALATVLTITALGSVGWVVWGRRAQAAPAGPEQLADWRSYVAGDSRVGSDTAPVTVVVFSDFQCPFCKRFAEDVHAVRAKHPGQVQMIFRHHPIKNLHAHATDAAKAAICAADQGRFEAMHDSLFAAQDSLGVRTWTTFAVGAGVADVPRFERCLGAAETDSTLAADLREGDRLDVAGTPTVMVNDVLVRWNPGQALLDSLVTSALSRTVPR
jgi:protein-disulfide isomerase